MGLDMDLLGEILFLPDWKTHQKMKDGSLSIMHAHKQWRKVYVTKQHDS